MAENLRTTKYNDNTSIVEKINNLDWSDFEALTQGARCAYNNDHYYVYPPGR